MPCGHELSLNPFREILEGEGGGWGRGERGSRHIDTEQFCSKQNASPMPAMAMYDVLVCGAVLAV